MCRSPCHRCGDRGADHRLAWLGLAHSHSNGTTPAARVSSRCGRPASGEVHLPAHLATSTLDTTLPGDISSRAQRSVVATTKPGLIPGQIVPAVREAKWKPERHNACGQSRCGGNSCGSRILATPNFQEQRSRLARGYLVQLHLLHVHGLPHRTRYPAAPVPPCTSLPSSHEQHRSPRPGPQQR
jgi:hypothetical protein